MPAVITRHWAPSRVDADAERGQLAAAGLLANDRLADAERPAEHHQVGRGTGLRQLEQLRARQRPDPARRSPPVS